MRCAIDNANRTEPALLGGRVDDVNRAVGAAAQQGPLDGRKAQAGRRCSRPSKGPNTFSSSFRHRTHSPSLASFGVLTTSAAVSSILQDRRSSGGAGLRRRRSPPAALAGRRHAVTAASVRPHRQQDRQPTIRRCRTLPCQCCPPHSNRSPGLSTNQQHTRPAATPYTTTPPERQPTSSCGVRVDVVAAHGPGEVPAETVPVARQCSRGEAWHSGCWASWAAVPRRGVHPSLPARGRPAWSPAGPALVPVPQFVERLTDSVAGAAPR